MGRLNKTLQTQDAKTMTAANTIRHIDVNENAKTLRAEAFIPTKRVEIEEDLENVEIDLRKVTDASRYVQDVDKVVTKMYADAKDRVGCIEDDIYCAKTGRFLFKSVDSEMTFNAAIMDNRENTFSYANSVFVNTVAPHFVNTSPEQIQKLKLIDPCGLFVWLSSRLAGDKQDSFDKAQGKAKTCTKKLTYVKERAAAFRIINDYSNESDENVLRVAVTNEIMLKILALTSHRGLYREFRSHNPLFVSLTNCVKDIDAWAEWLKATMTLLSDKLTDGKRTDATDAGIKRKADIMQGDTSFQSVVTNTSRNRKRQWIQRLGLSVVVFNHILDTITEEELLMPKLKDGAWPIDKLTDVNVRNSVHNTLIIKKGQGKASDIRGKGAKAVTARKKLRKAVELDDFLSLADIKPTKGY